ncbi:hypothetical protein [Amycolatopsis taiwanensis]|uniref:Uncharacterized protein n=1 Tax=Amycolatopsis taiwanensis TaxID=342230 RepID=A0A9W6QYZ5_9PSEU|nr:hypothetical protein [Amycolatopsis taiwanensis]GLY64622.1 hypothetical protein Atai01_12410 [Amycolatopsis taiwanensis]
MRKVLKNCYGALAVVALGMAVLLAAVFLVALIIGGHGGATLSQFGGTLAKWSIYVAAVAMLPGLVYVYLTGEHSLTAKKKEPATTTDE